MATPHDNGSHPHQHQTNGAWDHDASCLKAQFFLFVIFYIYSTNATNHSLTWFLLLNSYSVTVTVNDNEGVDGMAERELGGWWQWDDTVSTWKSPTGYVFTIYLISCLDSR